jgi:hypothetical protein
MMEDKYSDNIPFTWTSCDNRQRTFASTSFIYEMMIVSFLNYQADEFMEECVGIMFQEQTNALRQLTNWVFSPDTAKREPEQRQK